MAENPKEIFKNYISDIKEKFENTLDLYVNMALKQAVPKDFKQVDYNETEIYFILVIKEQNRAWLKDVKDALEMSVKSIRRLDKIWKCKVLVINEELARANHVIV